MVWNFQNWFLRNPKNQKCRKSINSQNLFSNFGFCWIFKKFHWKFWNWILRPVLHCHLLYDLYLVSYYGEHGYEVGRNRPVKLNHFDHGPVWISLMLHILWPIHACDASIFMFTGFKMNFLSHLLVFFLVHPYIWLEFIYSLVPCLYIEHKIELLTARITIRLLKVSESASEFQKS